MRRLLTSLVSLSYHPLEILVVDNNSTDDTSHMMANEFQQVIYVRTDRNIGVEARNAGMRKATGDIVITLDDDVIGLDDDAIRNILDCFSAEEDLGALNFKVIDPQTLALSNWVHHCNPDEYSHERFQTYEITEGAVAFRKSSLEKAGYYWDMFFISHEGPDLAFRLLDSGFGVSYTPLVTVNHYTAPEGRSSWRNYYFDTRNQFWLAARNFPIAYATKYLTRGMLSTLAYSIRDGFFRYWCKGVVDGARGMGSALASRKVLGPGTMKLIKEIDLNRPKLIWLLKRRLFRKGIAI